MRDLRSGDSNSTNRHEKEKGVSVQVLVRCRPLSEDEVRESLCVAGHCVTRASGMLATYVIQPINMIKVRIQLGQGSATPPGP
ncbi:hypothetical protein ACFX11_035774 [Malus domestica]